MHGLRGQEDCEVDHKLSFGAGRAQFELAAQIVKRVVQQEFPEKGDIPIVTTPTDDIRSYHVNSDKITRVLGFAPRYSVADAIEDLGAVELLEDRL